MTLFFQTPIQREILIQKIRTNPSLKRLFRTGKNVTQQINDDINHRLNGIINNFFTLHITGTAGSFKTTTAVSIAKKFDPTFTSTQRVSFEYEDYLEKFKTSQPKQIRQIDEQAFMRGTGSLRMIQEIQEHIESLRKRQNSLIIISPEKKYFHDNLFTYMFETIDNSLTATCPTNPTPHEPRLCTCYQNRTAKIESCKVRSAVKIDDMYLGFYIIDIDWQNPDWTEYELAKDEYMKRLVMGEKKRTDYEKIAQTILDENPNNEEYKNKKALKILVEKNRPNLTVNEIELVCESIAMVRRKNH